MDPFKFYILEDKKPVEAPGLLPWAIWFDNMENRRVAFDVIRDVDISTVFMGNMGIMFETMVFGGEYNYQRWKWKSYDEAVKGHHDVCAMVIG